MDLLPDHGLYAHTSLGCLGADARPNVLWISCEDIAPNLGCYGDAYASTPNLDRLASQGCRYTNAFACFPVCAPSRSAIITGMYPGTTGTMHMRTGALGYQAVPPPYVKCFPEYLRAAGYYCTNHKKTDYQFASPFTAWDVTGGDWTKLSLPKDQPFFSVINLEATHESQNFPHQGEKIEHDPAKAVVPPYYPDTPVVRQNLARYYDNITNMDRQVGHILKVLEQKGLVDNTVVFFWADHGPGLPRCKCWPYDSGLRVPLIVRWPDKIAPGSVCDELVNLMDLVPTMLSITGTPIPAYMQAHAILGPQKAKPAEYVFGGRNRMDNAYDFIRTVRDKRYRYIRNFTPEVPYAQPIPYEEQMPIMQEWRRLNAEGKLHGPQTLFFQNRKPDEELYDLTADPYEVKNLAGLLEYEAVRKRMQDVLTRWMKETGDQGGIPETELKERMWPGGKQPVTAVPILKSVVIDGARGVEITCGTEGASIGYRLDGSKCWLVYTGPVHVKAGTVVTAKAIRLGYKPSDDASTMAH